MKGTVRGKGLGNKIDPTKGSSPSTDLTAGLDDDLLLRILSRLPRSPYPCSLVCKRWLALHGLLTSSIRVRDWGFLEGGRMARRFPNLTDVDLTGAWLRFPSKQTPSILFTHRSINFRLETDAYDTSSIEHFIEQEQLPFSSLDKGLRALADGCPSLQRLCLVDLRRLKHNFREREQANANGKDADRVEKDQLNHAIEKDQLNHAVGNGGTVVNGYQGALRMSKLDQSCGGLAYVAKTCLTLQELVLHQCTDDSLYAISSCQNLQILRLVGSINGFYHCSFSDIGLTILAKGCSRLVKLELSGCEASYDGIAAIGQCCFMLEELTLSNQGFYEGWIAALFYCSCLKTLRLESCKQIDPIPGAPEHLRHCAALQRLELVRCCVRDRAGFSALMLVSVNVKELFFQDCWGLDDEMFRLVETCRYVRLLSLEGCSLVTTNGLEMVIVNWKDLHSLHVVYCNSVKDFEISPALALTFSTLKELKWRPDMKSLLAHSLVGTGVGQVGSKFFKHGAPI